MPELLLMRHAKSDWGSGDEDDRARPLAERGRKAARRLGRFLTAAGQVPALVLSSPAVRALETARLAVAAGGWSCPWRRRRRSTAATSRPRSSPW